MSTSLIIIIVAVVVALWLIATYNGLVKRRLNRENAFADIDVQLKQRHDLIPQLVNVVKGYAKHEKETLENVVKARSGALNARTVDEKIVAEAQLTTALSGLNIAVEAYPDLKANSNFMQLQEEISDVENKLAASRRFFNSSTKDFNVAIQSFPSNLVASMFGFKEAAMFEIALEQRAKAEEAPEINF